MRRLPKTITSLTNERVKAIRALEMRKERKATGHFVVEGTAIVESARERGQIPVTLVYQGGIELTDVARGLVDWALAEGVEVLEVTAAVMEKLAARDNPQSMLAVFRQTWTEPPAATGLAPSATLVVLEEVRDPGNLGTIVRTCDAAGASGVILVGECCDPFSHEGVRATMGSIFAVPLHRMRREDFLAWRQRWPGDVVGTHLAATDDFRNVAYRDPTLLVMGGEGPGLSEALAEACTRLVRIPMAGSLDSLNLAVATALTLYEIRRTRLTA